MISPGISCEKCIFGGNICKVTHNINITLFFTKVSQLILYLVDINQPFFELVTGMSKNKQLVLCIYCKKNVVSQA